MKAPWNFEEPACAEIGGEFFFPEPQDKSSEILLAKRICGMCTHKTECLEWALENEHYGIWGGTGVIERKAIRRMRKDRSAKSN